MSSEPLPLPEIWSDPPQGEVETARAELFANSRSSLVLIEYASGYAQQPDLQAFIRPVVPPRQPAARERLPSLAPAALLKGLADLGAIVTQAEALLRAQGTLKSDAHFAIEHIHDVAMALRMRDVEGALCDTLDASVREVGDALVRHEAAANGAFSAAALLRDIMRRLEDLTVVAARVSAADTQAPSRSPLSEAETRTEPSPPVVQPVVIQSVVSEEPRGTGEGREATFATGSEEEGAQLSQIEAAEMPRAGAVDVFASDDEPVHASPPAASDGNDAIAADLLATDAATGEATSAEAFATHSVAEDTASADAVAADIDAADTVAADVGTIATDTVATEIVVFDPVVSDTVAVDAVAADRLAADTVTADKTATEPATAEMVCSDAVATDAVAPGIVAADMATTVAIAADAPPSDVSADSLVASGSVLPVQAAAAPEDNAAAETEPTALGLPYEESLVAQNGREAQPVAPAPGTQDDDVVAPGGEGESAPTRKIDASSVVTRATPTNDPLAVLHGLSEEELIALFS
jgi:hypothetical protein